MNITKAETRDRKRHQARHGMRVNGKSVFTIQAEQVKRAGKAKAKKSK